jgi:hypothetical protein
MGVLGLGGKRLPPVVDEERGPMIVVKSVHAPTISGLSDRIIHFIKLSREKPSNKKKNINKAKKYE